MELKELESRINEVAQENAEMAERLAGLEGQLQAAVQSNERLAELLRTMGSQPAPNVTVSPAAVTVQVPTAAAPDVYLPTCDYEITHAWEGNRIVRSTMTRRP